MGNVHEAGPTPKVLPDTSRRAHGVGERIRKKEVLAWERRSRAAAESLSNREGSLQDADNQLKSKLRRHLEKCTQSEGGGPSFP